MTDQDPTLPDPDQYPLFDGKRIFDRTEELVPPPLWSEHTFQSVKRRLLRGAGATALALVAGAIVLFVVGAAVAPFEDRSFGEHQAHTFAAAWFAVLLFAVVALPVTWSLVHHGRHRAASLLLDRRYWRVLVVAYVLLPALLGVVLFVVANVVAIVLTIVIVLLLLILFVTLLGGM